MSRRALSQKQASVTLFPFLAVLICTMGSLIVLLVVVVQRARQQATVVTAAVPDGLPQPLPDAKAPSPPDPTADLATQLEDLQWANQVLTQSRQQTLQRLEQQRLELSRHEDRTRQLADKLKLLEQQAEKLLAAERQDQRTTPLSTTEVVRLQEQVEAARKELSAAQKAAENSRRQYALLPYDGPHSTRRRPIYIECLKDQVLLQPEGVQLVAEDFRDAGPHNPLAAALRATREYLLDAGATAATGEPYPLLVVRPGGARSYSACRNAMRSWDDEYGYELVPDEIELSYPPVDAALASLLTETVERARAAMSPLAGLGPYFTDESATNGVGPQSGSGLIPTEDGPAASGRGGGLGGRGGTPQGRGSGLGDAAGLAQQGPYGVGPGDSAASVPSRGTSGRASDGNEARAFGRYAATPGGGNGQSTGNSNAGGSGGPNSTHLASAPAAGADHRRDSAFPGMSGAAGNASSALAGASGAAGGSNGASGGTSATGSERFTAGGNAATGASGSGSSSSGHGTSAGGAGQGSSGTSACAGGSAPMPSSTPATASLAQTQGENWALPNAADGAIGITRPIRVICSQGGVVLLPETGTIGTPRRIAFQTSVRQAIQPLVTSIWDVIDSWGIAGPGVYWKPVLKVQVEPGAEHPFAEMSQLLEDSGLKVQRR